MLRDQLYWRVLKIEKEKSRIEYLNSVLIHILFFKAGPWLPVPPSDLLGDTKVREGEDVQPVNLLGHL